jgi:hypothetical protein
MMILPHTEAGALHAVRRVAAFISMKSMNRVATAGLITRDVNRNGIIRLTLTA